MQAVYRFDQLLSSELNQLGRHQIIQLCLLSIAGVFTASCALTYAFTARPIQHRCFIEDCGDSVENVTFYASWLKDAIPIHQDGSPSSCLQYSSINLTTSSCIFDKRATQVCDNWVFKENARTILTEFTLTCPENSWKLSMVGTINSFGCLIGLPLSGLLADRFGRKTALMVTILGGSIFGIARAYSPMYEVFLVFEFLEALILSGSYSIIFILAMEMVGPQHRELSAALIVWAYALGMVWLGTIAWIVQDWDKLLLAIYTPAILFVSYIWLVPESVRWLVLRDRLGEAKCLIRRAAKTNRIKLSETVRAEMDTWDNGTEATGSKQEEPFISSKEPVMVTLKEFIKSPRLVWQALNCSFCWITNTLVYYGLSLNSVTLANSDNNYLNFILVSAVEAPAYVVAWLGMVHIGRRRTLCFTLILSGVACILSPFINASWFQFSLYLFGKLTITAAFDTLYVFTAEIFPTRLRSTMMCVCSMLGRIGSMLAPHSSRLSTISSLFPMLLFGGVALTSGFLSLLFPETMGRTLPDTVQQAEKLVDIVNK